MEFTLSHTFRNVKDTDGPHYSDRFINNFITWFIEIETWNEEDETKKIAVNLCADIDDTKVLISADWKIDGVLKCSLGIENFDQNLSLSSANGQNTGKTPLFSTSVDQFSQYYDDEDLKVKVIIFDRKSTNLMNLPTYNFFRPFCGTDFILIVKESKLYCHSQILKIHSKLFCGLIGDQSYEELESINTETDFDSKDNVFNVTNFAPDADISASNVSNFLNELYCPTISLTESNVMKVLELSWMFDAKLVKYNCGKFLKNYDGSRLSKHSIMFAAWLYDIEDFKMETLDYVTSQETFCNYLLDHRYKNIPINKQLMICEYFLRKFQ